VLRPGSSRSPSSSRPPAMPAPSRSRASPGRCRPGRDRRRGGQSGDTRAAGQEREPAVQVVSRVFDHDLAARVERRLDSVPPVASPCWQPRLRCGRARPAARGSSRSGVGSCCSPRYGQPELPGWAGRSEELQEAGASRILAWAVPGAHWGGARRPPACRNERLAGSRPEPAWLGYSAPRGRRCLSSTRRQSSSVGNHVDDRPGSGPAVRVSATLISKGLMLIGSGVSRLPVGGKAATYVVRLVLRQSRVFARPRTRPAWLDRGADEFGPPNGEKDRLRSPSPGASALREDDPPSQRSALRHAVDSIAGPTRRPRMAAPADGRKRTPRQGRSAGLVGPRERAARHAPTARAYSQLSWGPVRPDSKNAVPWK
jgi:hypothetical protein